MMKIIDFFKKKKKEKQLPLIARVDLTKLQEQREKEIQNRDVSILAATDYTKNLPAIRLFYVSFELFNRYGGNELVIGQTYGISCPFRLPRDMSIEDACKVVSYLSDKVEKENNLEPASEKSVMLVSEILSKYGFQKVESKEKGHFHVVSVPNSGTINSLAGKEIEGAVDLFTVGCDFKVFKKSDLNYRYFDWYSKDITQQEIFNIYKNIHREHLLPDTETAEEEKNL